MNQVSHDLDLICWLIGQPTQVSALLGNQLHQAEIEDAVSASFRFENGAQGSFQASINQPRAYSVCQIAGESGMIAIQDARNLSRNARDRILLGSYGNLKEMAGRMTGSHDQPAIAWQTLGPDRPLLPTGMVRRLGGDRMVKLARSVLQRCGMWRQHESSGHAALMDSFVSAILNDETPLVSGESARQTVELVNAIILSAFREKTVELPIDRDEYDEVFEALISGKIRVPKLR